MSVRPVLSSDFSRTLGDSSRIILTVRHFRKFYCSLFGLFGPNTLKYSARTVEQRRWRAARSLLITCMSVTVVFKNPKKSRDFAQAWTQGGKRLFVKFLNRIFNVFGPCHRTTQHYGNFFRDFTILTQKL